MKARLDKVNPMTVALTFQVNFEIRALSSTLKSDFKVGLTSKSDFKVRLQSWTLKLDFKARL